MSLLLTYNQTNNSVPNTKATAPTQTKCELSLARYIDFLIAMKKMGFLSETEFNHSIIGLPITAQSEGLGLAPLLVPTRTVQTHDQPYSVRLEYID
jgi:hypothetical protein